MTFYLLLTCIDTLKGQPKYIDPFDWLKDQIKRDNIDLIRDLKTLKERYKENFGLSRRFKEAFTTDIDEKLQDELVDNLLSVKLNDSEINKESLNAWYNKDKQGKLTKIANTLYQIRSTYTHTSVRTFLPSQPLESVPDLNGEQLLCNRKVKLVDLLKKTILSLTNKMVSDSLTE